MDWVKLWQKIIVERRIKKPKNWDNEADKFSKISRGDEYRENLFSKMKISKEDTILDLGCGEGSITIPLAKKAKNVTAIDSSKRMLEILESKCKNQSITNVKIIKEDLEDVTLDELGNYDIVLLSRSVSGIYKINETLSTINNIANKYVYITIFGPNNMKFEKDFYNLIGNEDFSFPPYDYLFNILINMEIYPNIENLEIKTISSYKSIEDAMNNGKWNLDNLTKEEKNQLQDYLKKNLSKNKNGKLEHPDDKRDWILFWWKK